VTFADLEQAIGSSHTPISAGRTRQGVGRAACRNGSFGGRVGAPKEVRRGQRPDFKDFTYFIRLIFFQCDQLPIINPFAPVFLLFLGLSPRFTLTLNSLDDV
jgi:hypothetical protein